MKGIPDTLSVNSGNCENFAVAFKDTVPNSDIYGTDNFASWDSPLPKHIWLYDGKLHYDSECLDGVSNWMDLPIFKRYAATIRSV